MKRLLRLLNLSPDERRLLIVSAFLLAAIRTGMWLLPFESLYRLTARSGLKTAGLSKADRRSIESVGRAVKIASRYMPATCLTQALTTMVILKRLGHPALLRIGVSKGVEGKLRAHAWVESQGSVVIGELADLSGFSVLPSLERNQ